jgi:hypothetical protein
VDGLQRSDLLVRQLIPHSDDEIDIAMGIKVSNREGALQVGSYEQIAQGTANAGDQFFEDGVEFRVRCPMVHRRSSLSDALAILTRQWTVGYRGS